MRARGTRDGSSVVLISSDIFGGCRDIVMAVILGNPRATGGPSAPSSSPQSGEGRHPRPGGSKKTIFHLPRRLSNPPVPLGRPPREAAKCTSPDRPAHSRSQSARNTRLPVGRLSVNLSVCAIRATPTHPLLRPLRSVSSFAAYLSPFPG